MEETFYLRTNGMSVTGPYSIPELKGMLLPDNAEISSDQTEWIPVGLVSWLGKNECTENKSEETPYLKDCTGRSEEEDIGRTIGDALSMLWNTSDNLPRLIETKYIVHAILTIVFFTFFINSAGSIILGLQKGNVQKYLLLMLLIYAIFCIMTFIEISLVRIIFSPEGKGKVSNDLLLSGGILINTIPTLTVILLFSKWLTQTGPFALAITTLLIIPVGLFALCNSAAVLRIGMTNLYGMRPRHAIWMETLLLWSHIIILKVFF